MLWVQFAHASKGCVTGSCWVELQSPSNYTILLPFSSFTHTFLPFSTFPQTQIHIHQPILFPNSISLWNSSFPQYVQFWRWAHNRTRIFMLNLGSASCYSPHLRPLFSYHLRYWFLQNQYYWYQLHYRHCLLFHYSLPFSYFSQREDQNWP